MAKHQNRLIRIGEAAALMGVGVKTMRKSAAGTRYYDRAALLGTSNESAPTVGYARVSSPDQRADLDRAARLPGSVLRGLGLAHRDHPRPGQWVAV